MQKSRLLWLSWILVFLIIAKSNTDGRRESTAFQGIAESREVVVNSENAVEIRNIHVIPGQLIQKGRLLVELERPELTLKINEISHRLEEIRLQGAMDRDDIRSRIGQLKAEKKVIRSEAAHEISLLQSRLALNKDLAAGLQSIQAENQALKKRSPMETEIENLKEEEKLRLSQIQLQIDTLEKHLSSPENPVDVRIQSLEKELNLLLTEKNKLLVYARMDAMVGSVLCKIGEKISPFVPMLTLYQQSPSFVKAYIHEEVHHMAKVGEEVEIVSLSGRGKCVTARIVGTGSRIVEYPLRLRKRPDFQILGREVEIRLPEENPFLLGEKVMVYPLKGRGNRYLAAIKERFSQWLKLNLHAAESRSTNQRSRTALDIRRSKSLGNIPEIEASGLIYLPDLNQFLVISDETENRAPVLYLMDQEALVREKRVIRGIETIDDMEAICQDDRGNIYIACSQGRKKDGTLPDNRKILARIRRNGTDFEAVEQIHLCDLLKEAAGKNTEADWSRFIRDQDMEIEGIYYYEQDLYLGFKKPLKDERAVILRIREIDRVLKDKQIPPDKVEIWQELDLGDEVMGKRSGISDLLFHENRLYVLFSGKHNSGRTGALRVYDVKRNKIQTLYFKDRNPEGIALDTARKDSKKKDVIIIFDGEGRRPSTMLRIGDLT